MASVGKDRFDLQPLDPDGNLYEGRLGADRGDFEGLNVRNPQPGYVYSKARWLDHKGKPDNKRIMHFRRLGYEFPQDGESLGDPQSLNHGTNLEAREDITFGDLALMRCPIERVIARRAEMAEQSRQALHGGFDDFNGKGRGSDESFGSADRPIRFRLPGHGFKRVRNAEEV